MISILNSDAKKIKEKERLAYQSNCCKHRGHSQNGYRHIEP